MKVWMVERHWDLDTSILGIYSTKEKAIKAAEDEAKTELVFYAFGWRSITKKISIFADRSGMNIDFSLYVIEMEVQ